MSQYVFTMNRVGKIVPPKRHILKDISLSFFPGAKIGVLGLNGSGKSTLLNLVAGLIRGKKVDKALADLTFSKRRIAGEVKKVLQSAIANAENNHNLDVDSLVVAEAWVGKNLVMKRGRPRARGRFGKIMKPFSEITIKVRQVGETA
jgi:large subunit ribosomal protein L22